MLIKKKEEFYERPSLFHLAAVGRSFMLPVAILPIAGLLLGIGASFTNATTIQTYGLESVLGNGTILHSLLTIMSDAATSFSVTCHHLRRRRRHRHGQAGKGSRRLIGHDRLFRHARLDQRRPQTDWQSIGQ